MLEVESIHIPTLPDAAKTIIEFIRNPIYKDAKDLKKHGFFGLFTHFYNERLEESFDRRINSFINLLQTVNLEELTEIDISVLSPMLEGLIDFCDKMLFHTTLAHSVNNFVYLRGYDLNRRSIAKLTKIMEKYPEYVVDQLDVLMESISIEDEKELPSLDVMYKTMSSYKQLARASSQLLEKLNRK